MGRTFIPSLFLTNRDFDDAPKEIDDAGCVTAADPDKPDTIFTKRLYVHRGSPFHPWHPCLKILEYQVS